MTIEQGLYGVNWVCCAQCGVRQPKASLKKSGANWSCTDAERCKRFIAELMGRLSARIVDSSKAGK